MSYLLNLLNLETNTNTIIKKDTTLNTCIKDFESIFNFLYNNNEREHELKSTIIQGNTPSMSIFYKQEKLLKGYIYNSKSEKQVNLYEISLIPINTELTNLMCPVFQPIKRKRNSIKKSTRPFNLYKFHYDTGAFLKSIPEKNEYSFIDTFEYQPLLSESNSVSSMSPISSVGSVSPISPISPNKRNVNPLEFNPEFVDELKQKLNQLNFGLKSKIE
jgi:hypothetical protein